MPKPMTARERTAEMRRLICDERLSLAEAADRVGYPKIDGYRETEADRERANHVRRAHGYAPILWRPLSTRKTD
jgi:hypothetical protein